MSARADRAAVPGLAASRPMLTLLPAIFQEDGFAARWLDAFDTVVSPIDVSIDCFAAYLDPALSPEDFLVWVGSWLGADDDEELTPTQRRKLVASLVDLYGRRGTADSIRDLTELQLPVRCEVIEGGGAHASSTPGAPLPGSPVGVFVVRITAIDGILDDHQRRRARLIVDATRPAHLPVVVEFNDTPTTGSATPDTAVTETAVTETAAPDSEPKERE